MPTRVSAVFLLFALCSALFANVPLPMETNASSGVWNPNYDSEKLLIEELAPIMQSLQGQVMIKLETLEAVFV